MIRLEITDPATGKTLVPHLAADLSFEMIRENPLFYRRGDYTYDIDISLRDPHNRAIYEHIDRVSVTGKPTGRNARLLSDGHVIADGPEVVIRQENLVVKIQILSGYSALNILAGDDTFIRDMNFGIIEEPTTAVAKNVSAKLYPESNFVFPMLCKGTSTSQGYDNEIRRQMYNGCNEDGIEYEPDTDLWPQPYLLYYVEKFIEIMGFKLEYNALRTDERWKRLVVISGYRTLEYAKMLPDWTAAEFVNEIERFFNCVILINAENKKARIVTAGSFYDTSQTYNIADEDVEDRHICEYDTMADEMVLASDDLVYDLPSGDYWRYKSLPDAVGTNSIVNWTNIEYARSIDDNDWQIYYDSNNKFHFVFTKDYDSSGNATGKRCWIVNEYKHGRDNTNRKTMKIIPAQTFVRFYRPSGTYDAERHHIGIISAFPEYYDNTSAGDFTATVLGKAGERASDRMQVAFYTGITKAMIISQYEGDELKESNYYIAMIQTTPNMITQSPFITDRNGRYLYQQWHKLSSLPLVDKLTLALDGKNGRYDIDFGHNKIVNVDDRFTIRLRARSYYDPTFKFLIHGRLFVCQQLKYTYANGHQDPIVEGIFYPYI